MITLIDFIVRTGCAFLMGTLIGMERQYRQHSAGLRTNVLVAVGAAAFTILSVTMTSGGTGDPSRIAAQIVSGIGFLGGGLILKEGFTVRGLNTAATIWCSAACGTLAGVGMYLEAFVLVACVLITHCVFRPLGTFILKLNTKMYHYTVRAECMKHSADRTQQFLMDMLAFNKNIKVNALFYKGAGDKVLRHADIGGAQVAARPRGVAPPLSSRRVQRRLGAPRVAPGGFLTAPWHGARLPLWPQAMCHAEGRKAASALGAPLA